jgi:hypothetical protein
VCCQIIKICHNTNPSKIISRYLFVYLKNFELIQKATEGGEHALSIKQCMGSCKKHNMAHQNTKDTFGKACKGSEKGNAERKTTECDLQRLKKGHSQN